MEHTASRVRSRAVLAALGAIAALGAGLAAESGQAQSERGQAPSPLSQLRIEGPAKNVDPGTWYVTGRERIRRSAGLNCKRRQGRVTLKEPNALGIVESAARASKEMSPLRVRRDDFGLFACEIAGRIGRPFDHPSGFSGWLYWLDWASGSQAAENVVLEGGEQVLWVFSDFHTKQGRQRNSGGALELSGVPAWDADGTFTVSVDVHDFSGAATPVEGASIKGAESVEDLGEGEYEVTVGNGYTTLFARHRPDIASNQIEVCVNADPAQCPSAHGRTIVGSGKADVVVGTAGGRDHISTRNGDDLVVIENGGPDTVKCGRGEDEVVRTMGDDDDEIGSSCETVTDLVP